MIRPLICSSALLHGATLRGAVPCLLALALAVACQSEKKADSQVAPLAPATPAAQTAPNPSNPSVITKGAESADASQLTLVPDSSKLQLSMAKITKTHSGSFGKFTGNATLSGEQVQSVSFSVDTASLQTDTEKLTEHVKSKDFLEVEKFPTATFKSSSVVAKPVGGATHEVTGELTMHGVTQQISFPATIDITPDSVTGRAEVAIDRQKFGVAYPGMPDDLIKDEVVLKPTFVFLRKKS
jgi:polyisoprenoid-binding protein YceI